MSTVKISGPSIPNIPWQDRPAGCEDVVWRHSANPIIGWNPTQRTARVFNSAVMPYEGRGFVGIFRADHRDIRPHLHVGWSHDGLTWDIDNTEIEWKDGAGQPFQPRYAYDPRLILIEGIYYVVWCGDFGGAALGLGMTKDFRAFTRLENPLVPFNRNGVLFPRRIHGNYILLSRPSDSGHTPFGNIFLSESPDLVYWGKHRRVMTTSTSGWWQSTKIGAGPAPLETSEGWLLFYHGVTTTCNGFVYSTGAALLDLDDPARVLYRTRDYLLTPELSYETTGFVPNVAFPGGALCDASTGRIALYYGAADTHLAVAYTRVDELVSYIKANSQLESTDGEDYR